MDYLGSALLPDWLAGGRAMTSTSMTPEADPGGVIPADC
jgi:hypothetical protein